MYLGTIFPQIVPNATIYFSICLSVTTIQEWLPCIIELGGIHHKTIIRIHTSVTQGHSKQISGMQSDIVLVQAFTSL